MDSQKLNDWLQIIGLFGVIGSLVFVGIQMKQTQDIAVSDTYQSRTATTIDLNAAVMTSPELLSGFAKLYQNRSDEFTMQEAIAIEWWFGSEMSILENNHRQYEEGFLSQEHWERNLVDLECMLKVPFFREVKEDWGYRESFEAVVADLMPATPNDEENCWAEAYDWDYPIQ